MKKAICCIMLSAILLGGAAASAETGERLITLTGDGATFRGSGIAVNGSEILLTEPGEYIISGTLDNGRIYVDTGNSSEKISIVLDGADITCLDGPAIYMEQAEKLRLYVAEGTESTVTSGTEAHLDTFDDSRSGAAIYAEDDLDIKGPGKLIVNGFLNNGITCKDDIDLDGGTVVITAANNGIKGSESVEVNDGSITITAGNDGLKATSGKSGKGYVEINGGSVTIYCEGNGISAASDFVMTGGTTELFTAKRPIVRIGGRSLVSGGSITGNGEPLTFN